MLKIETKELEISEELKRKVEMTCRFASVKYERIYDYYEFAIDFIKRNHDIPKKWMLQYNYLLIVINSNDINSSLDTIINENKNIIGVTQVYLIKAICSDEDEIKLCFYIKKLCKSYANGITKVYTNNNETDLTLKKFTSLFFLS